MADDWESKHAAINSYECWKLAISELRKRRLEELAMQTTAEEKLFDFISQMLKDHEPGEIISALELRLMAMKEEYGDG